VIACCEVPLTQRAASKLREGAATRTYDQHLTDMKVYIGPFSAYCIMRSTDRQERLMNDMHHQSKLMALLTIAIAAMTAAVVALSVVHLWCG